MVVQPNTTAESNKYMDFHGMDKPNALKRSLVSQNLHRNRSMMGAKARKTVGHLLMNPPMYRSSRRVWGIGKVMPRIWDKDTRDVEAPTQKASAQRTQGEDNVEQGRLALIGSGMQIELEPSTTDATIDPQLLAYDGNNDRVDPAVVQTPERPDGAGARQCNADTWGTEAIDSTLVTAYPDSSSSLAASEPPSVLLEPDTFIDYFAPLISTSLHLH
jgi:hypothetical protein